MAEDLRALARDAGAVARALRPHAAPVLVLSLLAAALYWGTLRWLWNAWLYDDYYGHGLLVVPLALFFAWRARGAVAAAPARRERPSKDARDGVFDMRWRDLPVLGLAMALYAFGFAMREPFVFSLSLIVGIAGVLVYVLGWPKARPLVLPVAFLLFAVPIPNLLWVGAYLQVLAVWGTTKLLGLFQVPFAQDDIVIQAGGFSFVVVPLCSGLSSCISILMLTTVTAALSPLNGLGRGLLVAASIPLALFANVIRITAAIGIGIRWGPDASQGFFHGFSSLFLFLIAFAGVLTLALVLRRTAWSRAPDAAALGGEAA